MTDVNLSGRKELPWRGHREDEQAVNGSIYRYLHRLVEYLQGNAGAPPRVALAPLELEGFLTTPPQRREGTASGDAELRTQRVKGHGGGQAVCHTDMDAGRWSPPFSADGSSFLSFLRWNRHVGERVVN